MQTHPNHNTHHISALQVTETVAGSAEFTRNVEQGYNTQRAFARAALELAGMSPSVVHEDNYEPKTEGMTKEVALNAMTGLLPSFVYGLEGIRHHHDVAKQPYMTYRSFKARSVRFNHATKAFIDQDPSVSFASVSSTVLDLYGVLNRGRWGADHDGYVKEARWVKSQVEGVLRGMYQEVAAVQVIRSIKNADVSVNPHVSTKDDLKGADLYVTLDGVTFPLDIKASERTAQFARKKSSRPNAIITSGLPSPTSTDTFEIDPVASSEAADGMLQKLYAARAEFLASQS